MSSAHAERSLDAGDGAIMTEDGGVLLIGVDRPAKRNALTPGLLGRLGVVYESSDALRCAVLFGHRKAFCVGADLNEIKDTVDIADTSSDRMDPFSWQDRHCPSRWS